MPPSSTLEPNHDTTLERNGNLVASHGLCVCSECALACSWETCPAVVAMTRHRMQCTRCSRSVVIKVVMDAEKVVSIEPLSLCALHWRRQRTYTTKRPKQRLGPVRR